MSRNVWTIGGAFLIGLGLFWVGQGLGVIEWPASSFMIRHIQWSYYGVCLVILGLALIWWPRRAG